ncbi:AAA family ATPase, partial [Euzebya pacifica]|uniref:AAA family ATPase n=1 Tax=Euzebya pacifica TaxID=1608957 RepID=UPI0030FC3B0E
VRPDHYLVCAPDFAWVQDGTRESVAEREAMHADTLDRVQRSGVPFTVLTGGAAERLATAAAVCADATPVPSLA